MEKLNFYPTDDELRDAYIRKYPDTIFIRGQYMRCIEGVFRPIHDMRFREEVVEILTSAKDKGVRPTIARVNSVIGLINPKIFKEAKLLDANPDLFAFKNGVLNLKTGKFSAHKKENYISILVDFPYDPKAKCPYFLCTVKRFDPENKEFLREFFGLCLTTYTNHEIAIWLYGPPGSGKSTFIKGLQTMLGDYGKYLPARSLDNDRFGKQGIVGARLIYATEIPKAGINDTADLKAIISGEPIFIESKHKDGFVYSPTAKILWAMNYLPTVDMQNDGLGRRVKVVEFPQLPIEERDPNFAKMIAQEGPGIFNWAYQGLKNLRKRGKFIIPPSVQRATEQCHYNPPIKRTTNVILKNYIAENCVMGDGYKVQAGTFCDMVKAYCIKSGTKVPTSNEIATEMGNFGYRKSKHHGKRYYHGLAITTEGQ